MATPARSAEHLFAEEVRRADAEIDLARAALLLAKEEYPQISVEQYLARLDQLAEEVRDRLADEAAPLVVLQELLHVVYERHGFRGNEEAYYDPRNSYLNDVLDRRLGIPLTLAVVVLEVGWRLDLPLQGVNFPQHFLVRYRGEAYQLLMDPFAGGEIRFEDQAQEIADKVYGGTVRLQRAFLREASRRDMLLRMLVNLRALYLNSADTARAARVSARMATLRTARSS